MGGAHAGDCSEEGGRVGGVAVGVGDLDARDGGAASGFPVALGAVAAILRAHGFVRCYVCEPNWDV